MRILVTGARGLVGGPLVRRLRAALHEVAAVDLETAADVEALDVRDAAACRSVVNRFRPERVAHLAAWTNVDGAEDRPDEAAAVNVGGTRHMAEACRTSGAPMLYVSTDYVFDGTQAGARGEDDTTNPLSVYGRTKLDGERQVRELAPAWWIVRCQSIYGFAEGRKSFVDAILAQALAGKSLSVVADQVVCPSSCEDVAAWLGAVLLTAPPGTYHASSSGSCSWHECAEAICELAGLSVAVGRKTAAQHAAERAARGARTAARPANSEFDCSKLEAVTRLRMRPWREALRAYLISRRPTGAAQ